MAVSKQAEKNLRNKTRKVNQPYEVWAGAGEFFQVLRCYQAPQNEAKNEHAIRLCAYHGPYEKDSAGHDIYLADLKHRATLVWQDDGEGTMPARYTIS